MKYKITLNNRIYEVEVEAGKAMLLDEYEAVAPAAPAPAAPAAPVSGNELRFQCTAGAFAGNTTIHSVTAPDTGVGISISPGAFRGCTALETVNLPCIGTVGDDPFADCTSLKTVYLSESLTFMGKMNELPENVVFRYAGTKAQWKQVWFTYKEDRAPMEEQEGFEGE